MPKTLIVTIESAQNKTDFPAGTVAAGISISLSGGAHAPQLITAAPYVATFPGVQAGQYTWSAQTVDNAGQPLGALVTSAEFTVDADPATIDIPQSISFVVQ